MLARTERGEQARDYFIKIEEKMKELAVAVNLPQLTTNQIVLKLAEANVELEREMREVREEVRQVSDKFDTAIKRFTAPNIDHWKVDMETKINEMVEAEKLSPMHFRGQLYTELEQTAIVSLSSRQKRMMTRMKTQGVTYQERRAITKLDVISKDKQLRAIFESIVKKRQALCAERL